MASVRYELSDLAPRDLRPALPGWYTRAFHAQHHARRKSLICNGLTKFESLTPTKNSRSQINRKVIWLFRFRSLFFNALPWSHDLLATPFQG
jgi:hypothetical protein